MTDVDRTHGLPAGTQLNGTYEVDSLIAIGGMGEVYRGHLIETGDRVAIKVIRPDMMANEAALMLFRKEASALHHLNHASIIRYFVFAIDPTIKRPYLAMEFVDGEPLSEIVSRGGLSPEQCHILLDRLAGGLAAAHDIGIVHRDMSPDNVILPGGDVTKAKIIDFGIAKSTQFGAATVIGDGFAGKYSYVSPEQLGLFGGDVTAKSDIYSLGLVIAQASSGRIIDMGRNHLETIERRRTVPVLDGVAPSLLPIIQQMLQPVPADRPASMEVIRHWVATAAFQSSGPTRVPPPDSVPVAFAADPTVIAPSRRRGRLREAEDEIEDRQEAANGRRKIALVAAAVVVAAGVAAIALTVIPRVLPGQGPELAIEGDPMQPLPTGPQSAQGRMPPPLLPSAAPPQAAVVDDGETSPPLRDPSAAPAADDPPVREPQAGTLASRIEQILVPGARPAPGASTSPPAPAPTPPPVAPTTVVVPPPVPAPPVPALPVPPVRPVTPEPSVRPAVPEPPKPAGQGQAPPVPAVVPPPARVTAADFVARTNRESTCQFAAIRQSTDRSAVIEAFGSSVQAVQQFDKDFNTALGFEANIQFRPLNEAQCPAVEFMRLTPARVDPAVRFELRSVNVKAGQTTEGTIIGAALRNVSVLVAMDDGSVVLLPVRSQGGSRNLAVIVPTEVTTGGQKRPKLALAILSNQKPKALDFQGVGQGATVFPALVAELAEPGQSVSVLAQYFRLEN